MLKKAFLLAGRAGIKSVAAVLLICIGVSFLSGCGMISLIAANGLAGNNVQPNFSDKQTQTEGTAPKDELKHKDEMEPPDDETGNQSIPAPDISEAVDTTEKNTKTYMIDAISASNCTIDRIEIESFSDSITQNGEKKRYTINTAEAGTYRFEFSDIPQNIQFSLYLYNSNMEQLQKATYCSNGYGMTAELGTNAVYYLHVVQAYNVGSYTLNFGFQKPTCDVSGYHVIRDSIQYTDQKNYYRFVPETSAVHEIAFSISGDARFTLYVYNSYMEQLAKEAYRRDGDGLSIELDKGEIYYIVVAQENGMGRYDLIIQTQ